MQSDRLYCRKLHSNNLESFFELQSNPKVMQYVGRLPMTFDECKEDLKHVISHYSDQDSGFRVWGFFQNTDHELIGIGAIISNEKGNEIGYRIREKYWGKGFGMEITEMIISYAFDQLNLDSIFAEVDQRNLHSIKILDQMLSNKRAFFNTVDQTDDFYYELSRQEYEKN